MPSAAFDAAIPFVLRWEGGYVDDRNDHGGVTNKGITQRVYDAFRAGQGLAVQDVSQIGDAQVMTIYETNYWRPPGCDLLPPSLDLVQLDTAVNMGPKRAVMFLQGCLGCTADGSIGDQTEQAVRQCNAAGVIAAYCDKREQFYQNLVSQEADQAEFLKGWMNRLNALRAAAGVPGYAVSRAGVDFDDRDYIARVPDIGDGPTPVQPVR